MRDSRKKLPFEKVRSCLRCDGAFRSVWFGNRLCPSCSAEIARNRYGRNSQAMARCATKVVAFKEA